MELGITIPLERFLKRFPPPYGSEADRRFCWDLHVIDLRGQKSLLAVHCHSFHGMFYQKGYHNRAPERHFRILAQ